MTGVAASRTRGAVIGAIAVAMLALTVSGCSSAAPAAGPPSDRQRLGPGSPTVHVRLDAPDLVALKRRAGIADCPTSRADAGPVSGGLPDVTLPCLGGGRAVDLAGLAGAPTVVNLWASWCGPCRTELRYFQRLHRAAGPELRVLGIDYLDLQPRQALALAADRRVTYPLLADPNGELKAPLRAVALPQTVFVGRDGRITGTVREPMRSYAQLVSMVRRYLRVTP